MTTQSAKLTPSSASAMPALTAASQQCIMRLYLVTPKSNRWLRNFSSVRSTTLRFSFPLHGSFFPASDAHQPYQTNYKYKRQVRTSTPVKNYNYQQKDQLLNKITDIQHGLPWKRNQTEAIMLATSKISNSRYIRRLKTSCLYYTRKLKISSKMLFSGYCNTMALSALPR